MTDHKYPIGYRFRIGRGEAVYKVIGHTPAHHVIEQLAYQPHYRVTSSVLKLTNPWSEFTMSEEDIEEGHEVSEEKDPKYEVGVAFREEGSPTHWFLITDYDTEKGTYSIEDTGSSTFNDVSEKYFDGKKLDKVDWKTGLAEDEMRVRDLKLGSKFFLVDGIQVWKVQALEKVNDPVIIARSSMPQTKVHATTEDGGYTISHKFIFRPSDILLKPKEA